MMFLLSVTIKIACLVLGALAATALLRQRSAALRHWILATALFGCVTIPALERLMPAWSIPLPIALSESSAHSSIRVVSEPSGTPAVAPSASADAAIASRFSALPDVAAILASVWLAGVFIGVATLTAGLWRLRRLAAESELISAGIWRDVADDVSRRYGIGRQVRLLSSRHSTMLATWGTLNPAILLPAGAHRWAPDRIHAVLHHELAHVVRGDWIVALTAGALRAVYWFNPLLWIAYHRLRHEGERACDDLVLASGISGSDYAAHLLDVARELAQRRGPWSPAIAIAHHSTLEGRVRAMLAVRVNRDPLSTVVRATTVAVLAAITVSIGIVTVSGNTERTTVPDVSQVSSSSSLPVLSRETERPDVPPQVARPAAAASQTQTTGGTIEGVLYDPYGGLLPGVSVRLTQVGQGAAHNALTDRAGAFSFRGLAAGDYELVTDLPGFVSVKNVIHTEPGATVRRHIALPIGTVQETILVTCTTADLASSRPTAPTASASPGAAQPQAAAVIRRGTPPKFPSTFTGGIGGQIKAPTKLAHVNPVCPSGVAAQPAVVRLAGRIGIDGLFSDLHSTSTDALPAFVASAMEAARKWEFTPTLLNNAPIEANITVTVSYSWN